MAVKSTGNKPLETAEEPAPVDETAAPEAAPARGTSDCVVDEPFHVGRATPGSKVCSYHAMHYSADGTKRA